MNPFAPKGANSHRRRQKPTAALRATMHRLILHHQGRREYDTNTVVLPEPRLKKSWWTECAQPEQRESFVAQHRTRMAERRW